MQKSVGILIRLTRLTETSLIVTWCTEEHGLIKTVAKGARRPKSKFTGKLDLFYSADLDWVKNKNDKSELHHLHDVAVRDYRQELRKNYNKLQLASYFTKLIENVAEKDSPIPDLYNLLERGLNYLSDKQANKKAMLHFESQLAELLGLGANRSTAYAAICEISGATLSDRLAFLKNISDLH